jgi:hypothetical protein
MSTPRIFLAFLFVFFCGNLFSQEQLGMRLSNYAGVNSLPLNPAGNLSNPLSWDVNIVGTGLFFENNYAFLRQTNSFELLKNRNDAEFLLAEDVEGQVRPNAFIVDFYDNNRKRYMNFSSFVTGPSFVVKLQDKHSFGVFTRFQSRVSAQRIPSVYSYYRYDRRAFFEDFSVSPFDGAAMSWSEIGLNYALKIPASYGAFGFGINVRFLQGYEAGYLENMGTLEHTKLPGNTITLGQPDGRFGYASSNLEGGDPQLQRNGSGLALDLGFIQLFQESEDGYRLRLGASILDLGYLNFNKNAFAHRVETDSVATLNLNDYQKFDQADELDDLIRTFSQDAMGDSLASLSSNSFRMAMPAAVSIQADYSFTPNFYLNALALQRFYAGSTGVKRGSLLALTPRFEHRWLSVSLPVSVYNWQDVRLGLAARLGLLVVGSDNLLSWVGQGSYTGTDFYIALKLNPFDLGLNFGGGNGSRHHGRNKKVKCYDF